MVPPSRATRAKTFSRATGAIVILVAQNNKQFQWLIWASRPYRALCPLYTAPAPIQESVRFLGNLPPFLGADAGRLGLHALVVGGIGEQRPQQGIVGGMAG